jgi:hypothetical protein
MAEQDAPPPGVTLDSTPVGPPPGVTLDQPPAGVTLDSAPPQHGILQGLYDGTATRELGELASGFKTALNQTGETAMSALGATGIPQRINPEGWERSRQQTHEIASQPLDTPGKMSGAAIEQILEFTAAEGGLKLLTPVARISELARVERALKNSPILTRMLGNAVRAQAIGTTQAAVHGATGGQAVAAGSAAALLGGATEGAIEGGQKLLNLIRPTTSEVLGETVPVLASQQPGASPVAESVADIRSTPTVAAEQQAGAQRGIVNRAQQTAASELHRLNAARASRWVEGEGVMNLAPEETAPTAPLNRQLGTGQAQLPEATATSAPQLEAGAAAPEPTGVARTNEVGGFEGEFPAQPETTAATTEPPPTTTQAAQPRVSFVEERPPNFAPLDVAAETQGIRTFGDAADKIREHASPIFDRLDNVTNGEYTRLRDLRDAAYAAEDYTGVRNAEREIDKLFDWQTLRGKIDRADYRAGKSAWKTSKMLDAVHDAVSKAFNISSESLANDAGVWRGINGGTLMRGIDRLERQYGRTALEEVIGKDGLTGLLRISSLTQSPQRAAMYGQKVGDVAHDIMSGDRNTALIPAHLNWARRKLLHSLAVNPRVGQLFDYAYQYKIPSATVARMLTGLLEPFTRPVTPQEPTDAGSQ